MTDSILVNGVLCDSVLISEVMSINESLTVRLSWLRTITRENYEQNRTRGSAEYTGYGLFDGDYDQFNERRQRLFAENNFNLDLAQSRQVLLTRVTSDKVAAWSKCVTDALQVPSLVCWFDNVHEMGGILRVRWKPVVGLSRLRNVRLEIPGALTPAVLIAGDEGFEGEKAINVRRATDTELFGTINGTAGAGGAFSAAIYLPAPQIPCIVHTYAVDVGVGVSAQLYVPAQDGNAKVAAVVTCAAVWEQSGDPAFWFDVGGYDGRQVWRSGRLQVFEGAQPRVERHAFTFDLPAHTPRFIVAHTDNNHAVAKQLKIEATVTNCS